MHVSYISLALFAIGSIAAPVAPKSSSDVEDTFTGFPFTPLDSSVDPEEAFDRSFSSALEDMKKSAQHASSTSVTLVSLQQATPTPTHEATNTLSQAAHVASETPEVSNSASSAASTPSKSDSAASSLAATPTPSKSDSAASSLAATPTPSKSDSASSPLAATPSPKAANTADPLGTVVKGIPVVGPLLGGSMAALGLHR